MDRVLFTSNERVDQADVDAISDLSIAEFARNNADLLAPAPALASGFFFTIDTATSLRLDRGAAIVPQAGGLAHGQLTSEGVAQQPVSFLGLAIATYKVWIRFTYAAGERQNRVVWDADLAAEKIVSVDTRAVAGWDARVAEITPGPEWVALWSVAWDGSSLATSVITDIRPRLFEGAGEGADYTNAVHTQNITSDHHSTWGAGNDRDHDRGRYGVSDMQTFVQAVIQKFDEIQGGVFGTNPLTHGMRWWSEPATGSLNDMVPLSGTAVSGAIRGPIVSDTTSGRALTIQGVGQLGVLISDGGSLEIGAGTGGILVTGTGGLVIPTAGNSGITITGASNGGLVISGTTNDGIAITDGGDIAMVGGGDIAVDGGGSLSLTNGGVGVYVGDGGIATDNAAAFIGQTANPFAELHAVTIGADNFPADTIYVDNVGAATQRVTTVRTEHLDMNGVLTMGGTITGDLKPSANLSGKLGDAALGWESMQFGIEGAPSLATNVLNVEFDKNALVMDSQGNTDGSVYFTFDGNVSTGNAPATESAASGPIYEGTQIGTATNKYVRCHIRNSGGSLVVGYIRVYNGF